LYVFSVSLHRSGLLKDALRGFSAAIKADSSFSLAFNGRALVHLDLADTNEARKDLMIATNRDTTLANAYYNISHIFFNRELGPPTMIALNLAIQNDSTFSRSYYLRGMAHAQYSHYGAAIADFHRAIELNPDFPADRYFLALAYLRSADYNNAETWFREFLEMSPAGMEDKVKRARDHLRFIAEEK
jgi:tetratricopeptide (TPR) repeat protein